MEKLIKSILYEIAEKTYNKKPQNFELKIVPEERKSFHGQCTDRNKSAVLCVDFYFWKRGKNYKPSAGH